MSRLVISLFGPPVITRDGTPVNAPKGNKVWALLAYLLRAEGRVSRERLASLLFADADDPLGALRWNLSQLRTLLGDKGALRGEPLTLQLPPEATVDVDVVLKGSWRQAIAMGSLGGTFLEGMKFPTSSAFEVWLLTERRHLSNASADVMREAAVARIAAGAPAEAVRLAGRLVEIDPLDEAYHALLIRSLAAAGDREAARAQLEVCRAVLRRELGVAPGPDVINALEVTSERTGSLGGSGAARAQLDAGRAAITAGAVDAGVDALRRAVLEAEVLGDPELHAESLLALGGTLVHSLRGRDEEASVLLHRALGLGQQTGMPGIAAAARRELGYVEMLRARYERAVAWLHQGLGSTVGDPVEEAATRTVLGACWSDTAHYPEALQELEKAVALAEEAGDGRQVAFASSFLGRCQLLTGNTADARSTLQRSLQSAQREGWTSLVPWPESMLGDCSLMDGDLDGAAEVFEHAFALGCHLGDPCWEGMGARGIGLVHAQRGAVDDAIDWLDDARTRCMRIGDAYRWIQVHCEDALCQVATEHGVDGALQWIDDLESHAGRADMRDYVARAYLHRHRMGDESALEAARVLAAPVDSAALHHALSAAGG